MVGMFQKEVGERMASKTRTKDYGILSVFTQAYFDVEYLFTVHETVFDPPPKVKSGVSKINPQNHRLMWIRKPFLKL
jgi:16S rRNA (adenine1518-N6/adenine1519-N6)-dimethyltransferase